MSRRDRIAAALRTELTERAYTYDYGEDLTVDGQLNVDEVAQAINTAIDPDDGGAADRHAKQIISDYLETAHALHPAHMTASGLMAELRDAGLRITGADE